MIREVRRRLHHAPGVALGANTSTLSGIGYDVVMSKIVTPRPGKAVGEDAAFQIFTKGLADKWLWRVVLVWLDMPSAGAHSLLNK